MPPGRSTRIHALAFGVRLRQHRELAVAVLEEPGRPLVDQLVDACLAPGARRSGGLELDDGLPAAGHDHAALHETVGRVAAESRPVAPESLRPLLEKPWARWRSPRASDSRVTSTRAGPASRSCRYLGTLRYDAVNPKPHAPGSGACPPSACARAPGPAQWRRHAPTGPRPALGGRPGGYPRGATGGRGLARAPGPARSDSVARHRTAGGRETVETPGPVHRSGETTRAPFRRILVAVDGSDHAFDAVRVAARLAAALSGSSRS